MSAFGFPPPNDPGLSPPLQYTGVNVMSPAYNAKGDGVTDDTVAVQGAINAASAKAGLSGIVDVILPSGYGFNLSEISPKPGVRLRCDGATIIPNLAGIPNGLLHWNTASSLSRFEVYRGAWLGTGTETGNQLLFMVDQNAGCNDIVFRELYVPNWNVGPLYFRNPLRVKVLYNTLLNPGQGSTYNSVNFVADGTFAQGSELLAHGNIIDGSGASAISYVNSHGTGPAGAIKFIASNNICSGIAGGNNITGNINMEFDGTGAGTFTDFLVIGNDINCPNVNAQGVSVSGPDANAVVQRSLIMGNHIATAKWGIAGATIVGQDIVARGNRISGATIPFSGTIEHFDNKLSIGPSAGRAVLVAGTVTVSTPEIQTGDNVILTVVAPGGTRGEIQLGTIVNGTSFVINSIQPGTASTLQTLDTSTVYWRIDH